jgi:hypothetical protein
VSKVIVGMDPHKNSATIEVMAGDEAVVGGGRYATDAAGYAAMLAGVRRWPDRIWAIEGCRGIGRHLASRLVADGEQAWTCRRSCRPAPGSSPPGRAARPMRPMRTPSPWPPPG